LAQAGYTISGPAIKPAHVELIARAIWQGLAMGALLRQGLCLALELLTTRNLGLSFRVLVSRSPQPLRHVQRIDIEVLPP